MLKKSLKIEYGVLIVGTVISIVFFLKGNFTHEGFDSDKWKNRTESEVEWSLRWDMMNSLRNKHELKGKTRAEIIDLLGEPDSKTDSEFSYYLGMARHGIDIGTLTIKFGKNGIVSQYNVNRS